MLTLLVVLAMQGDIHGRVVSAANNTPVAMATVSVRDSTSAAPLAQTTTDVDGAFRVQGLPRDAIASASSRSATRRESSRRLKSAGQVEHRRRNGDTHRRADRLPSSCPRQQQQVELAPTAAPTSSATCDTPRRTALDVLPQCAGGGRSTSTTS